jgi:hypothetical protein
MRLLSQSAWWQRKGRPEAASAWSSHRSKPLSLVPLELALRPVWIAFKHGGERNIEDLANVKETGRTDPVATPFIFLNLLEADAQCPAKFVLAHVEGKPSFAHSSTDVRVNGGCVPWCALVNLRFFISAHF